MGRDQYPPNSNRVVAPQTYATMCSKMEGNAMRNSIYTSDPQEHMKTITTTLLFLKKTRSCIRVAVQWQHDLPKIMKMTQIFAEQQRKKIYPALSTNWLRCTEICTLNKLFPGQCIPSTDKYHCYAGFLYLLVYIEQIHPCITMSCIQASLAKRMI